MNVALVMLLALIWGVVLIPSAVRNHRRNTVNSIGGFERAMTLLAPHPVASRRVLVPQDAHRIVAGGPSPRARMLARRRTWLYRLAGTTASTFATSVLLGGLFTRLFVLSLLATAAYVAALRAIEVNRQNQRRVVSLAEASARAATASTATGPAAEQVRVGAGRW